MMISTDPLRSIVLSLEVDEFSPDQFSTKPKQFAYVLWTNLCKRAVKSLRDALHDVVRLLPTCNRWKLPELLARHSHQPTGTALNQFCTRGLVTRGKSAEHRSQLVQ